MYPENFYNKEIASKVLKIEDLELMEFYVEEVISRIENIIGYKLFRGERKAVLSGLDKNIVYLKEREIERVLNVFISNEEVYPKLINNKLEFNRIIKVEERVEINYVAGYEILPSYIQNFIFSTIKKEIANPTALTSYSIEGISYSFDRNDTFEKDVFNFFGVRC